ncbi:MAG: 1-acyl-sn-glycerol-3-phosphate acyltransferase [Candidatus Woesearchaeota archaeon]
MEISSNPDFSGLERVVIEQERLSLLNPGSIYRGFMRQITYWPALGIGAALLPIRPKYCENVHLTGIKEHIYKEGKPVRGPFLWALKHESWFDALDLIPEIHNVPETIRMKVIVRDNYFKNRLYNSLMNFAAKPYGIVVKRTGQDGQYLSDEERERLTRHNIRSIGTVLYRLMKGDNIFFLPEGTTRNNGTFIPLKSGLWRASHHVFDGKLYVANCVPVGNTYDFMAGVGDKHQVFINIGEIFHYEPVEFEGESSEAYRKKDKLYFAERLREKLVELHTFTTSQLGGLYIRALIEKGKDKFSKEELYQAMVKMTEELQGREHGYKLFFDPDLLNSEKRFYRFERLFSRMIETGYVSMDGFECVINKDRMQYVPPDDIYKAENPWRYMTNRPLSGAKMKKSLKNAFERSLEIDLDRIEAA